MKNRREFDQDAVDAAWTFSAAMETARNLPQLDAQSEEAQCNRDFLSGFQERLFEFLIAGNEIDQLERLLKALRQINRITNDTVSWNIFRVIQDCQRSGEPVPAIAEFEAWLRANGEAVSDSTIKKKRKKFKPARRQPGRPRLGAKSTPYKFPAFYRLDK